MCPDLLRPKVKSIFENLNTARRLRFEVLKSGRCIRDVWGTDSFYGSQWRGLAIQKDVGMSGWEFGDDDEVMN